MTVTRRKRTCPGTEAPRQARVVLWELRNLSHFRPSGTGQGPHRRAARKPTPNMLDAGAATRGLSSFPRGLRRLPPTAG